MVQAQMQHRDEFLQEVQERLEQAQQQYKHFYDRKHQEVTFTIGQWVWLRLIHRSLASLDVKGRTKLGPKFYGSFLIVEKIGDVASMSGCSSHSRVSHQLRRRSCPPFTTVVPVLSQKQCYAAGWPEVAANYSCNGRDCRWQTSHGLIGRSFGPR
jgi:hypothetical protein